MLIVRSIIYSLLAGCLLFISGCAADSKGPVANVYHNTTARYNAYFLAREKMAEVEKALEDAQERNFNKLLYIFPDVDTTVISSVKPQLQDVLKKASIAIERHKNSKWTDDSYILVGKVRFYSGEFENAVETYKYVNVKSKNDDARHQALINLMRTFIAYRELNNAKAVADYLRKENLNSENLRRLNLVKASFYKEREDFPQMAAALEAAAPETKKSDGRARLYYILGQVYQLMEEEEKAYESFKKSLKSNPDYELSFYARLSMAQVFNLAKEQDEKKIRKYFSKLLKDKKNKEYRDKIYYEMGRFEARQGNLDAAVSNYKKSAGASINNPRQKSYAYLRLAELYFDTLNNYQLSKVYYDSTLSNLPPDEAEYPLVEKRQKVLTDLVTQLNTIHENDSLLRLVQLDSTALTAFLGNIVQEQMAEERRLAQLAASQRTLNQVNVRPGFNNTPDKFGVEENPGGSGASWYFYNAGLVSTGQAEFIKTWGDRPLQDNWRRFSSGQRENTNVVTQQMQTEQFTDENPAVMDEAEELANRTLTLYGSLPTSPEQQTAALADIESAYYRLGKIYYYDLEEWEPSVNSFDSLLIRFPETEHRPEVLYQLYLLYKGRNEALSEKYKQELVKNFPNTTFAKVALNPNFEEESDQAAAMLKEVYAQAYRLYQEGTYGSADSILVKNLQMYPDNSFSDQLRLLQILITGKTEGTARYQYSLNQFIEKTSNERLRNYAGELLQASYDFSKNNARREGTRYIEDFDQPHYFLLMYENEKKLADPLIKAVDSFNLENYSAAKLSAVNLRLNDKKAMVYVSQFRDRGAAMQYFRSFERKEPLPEGAKNGKINFFVISKDNFQILYDSKDFNSYLKFFDKFYN